MSVFLIVLEVLILIVVATLLLQCRNFMKALPKNEELGEKQEKYITDRLNWLRICLIVEAVLALLSLVLRFVTN